MPGSTKVFKTLGSSNHTPDERAQFDYYATDPQAVEMLLALEPFAPVIWEPACGEGHISKVLAAHGYEVISTDLIYRGFGEPEPMDFLTETFPDFEGDIITNPPYGIALDFIQRALDSVQIGRKVTMLLKIQFLEGQRRKEFFTNNPPKTIYVSRSRIRCALNGNFDGFKNGSTICYAWYVWEKGFTGDPVIKWFN